MKVRFGHCIGCDQPIRPPFLSFIVQQATGDGTHILFLVSVGEPVQIVGRQAAASGGDQGCPST